MKQKRIIAFILCIAMLMSTCYLTTFADGGIGVYITISKNGKVVTDKNNNEIALAKLELPDNEGDYTLADAFLEAHKQFFEDGENGFLLAEGTYGSYVKTFWGDSSENFGYQVNGAEEAVMGPNHLIKDGDYIDFAIYENLYPNTESYTKFDRFEIKTYVGKEEEITLNVAGYDENWSTVFSPCDDAEITINSKKTAIFTDEKGKATLAFDKPGTYIISALKEAKLAEQNSTTITAPVCRVEVGASPLTVIENIAKKYSSSAILNDVNMSWFLVDMGCYNRLYPKSKNALSDKLLQKCMDELIEFSNESDKPSDLAKVIIAMRSMGYDASNVYDKNSKHIDISKKLLKQVDEREDNVTNAYVLPYVIIALREYANEAQMEYLINTAIEIKEEWQDTTYGPDGATPIIAALAPYYESNADVRAVIDETISMVIEMQMENGLINSMGAAASTGIAMVGFSALGIDSETVKNNGNSLIDGLMAELYSTFDGFLPSDNTFSTEQGFRGLLAWQMFKNGMTMYDFSNNPKKALCATVKKSSGGEGKNNGTYVPQKSGTGSSEQTTDNISKAITQEAPSEIDFNDVKADAWYYEDVKFVVNAKLMGGTDKGFEPEIPMTRAMLVTILYRMEDAGTSSYKPAFSDVEKGSWYYDAVCWASENGIVSGISDTEFAPDINIVREQLATILYRYAKFKGIIAEEFEDRDIVGYSDSGDVSEYARTAMLWAVDCGLIKGESSAILNPQSEATRAQTAAILKRFCQMQGETK